MICVSLYVRITLVILQYGESVIAKDVLKSHNTPLGRALIAINNNNNTSSNSSNGSIAIGALVECCKVLLEHEYSSSSGIVVSMLTIENANGVRDSTL